MVVRDEDGDENARARFRPRRPVRLRDHRRVQLRPPERRRPDGSAHPQAGVALGAGLGSAAYYTALDVGNISIVSTVTALYFVVAVVLGVVVLRESLDPSDVAGMLLAVGAVALLAR